MKCLITGTIVVFLSTVPAAALDLVKPDPKLSPKQVVEIQLRGLQKSGSKGIEQTWIFAHPNNKASTGPIERFAAMLQSPYYNMMLGHRNHSVQRVLKTKDRATFAVTILAKNNQRYAFQWELAKVKVGKEAGAWMTVGVTPPLKAKDAI